jgi:zinc protease
MKRMESSILRPRALYAALPALAAAALSALAASTIACSSAPPPSPPPPPRAITAKAPDATSPEPRAPEREPPPPSGPTRDLRLPYPMWAELPSGLKVAAVENRSLPVVHIRVAVLGGSAADGERPGVAALTAELLKRGGAGAMTGRDVLARAAALGGELSVRADFDRTTLSLSVTKDALGEALDLLAAVVGRPSLSPAEFTKIKKRAADTAAERARDDAAYDASLILFRDLFSLPADRHPYASFDASPEEISRLTATDCRTFHARRFVPKNTFVVIAGDVTSADAKAAVVKAFNGFTGGEPAVTSFTDPVAPESIKITLIDRPKSAQSVIRVGMLGPARSDEGWPAFMVASQILGGDVTGRLSNDLVDKRALALSATSNIIELASSPSVFYVAAETPTPKTGHAMKALLEHIDGISAGAPTAAETEAAARALSDALAIRLGSVGDLADAIVHLRTLGLWDDALAVYTKALRAMTPEAAGKAAPEHFRSGHAVVVVAGDAEVVGPVLSHFAEVKVVDPTKGFQRLRSIPMNAGASLDAVRPEGP